MVNFTAADLKVLKDQKLLGIKNHIKGTDGADTLTGGKAANMIHGKDGDDNIFGGAGDDIIYGSKGVDVMRGGTGDDWIGAVLTGENGKGNTAFGGKGNDIIKGGDGDDILNGGAGHDIIFAGGGNDDIKAGAGNDFIRAGAGNDKIVGGAGKDIIYAGLGADVITAGMGDRIHLGAESATVRADGDSDKIDLAENLTGGKIHIFNFDALGDQKDMISLSTNDITFLSAAQRGNGMFLNKIEVGDTVLEISANADMSESFMDHFVVYQA